MPYERRLGVIDISQMPIDNRQSTDRDYKLPFAWVCNKPLKLRMLPVFGGGSFVIE